MNLRDSVVVVTGSSSGIGRTTAVLFASQGARLILNSKSNLAGGEQLAREIQTRGGKAVYVQADLGDPDAVAHLFDRAIEEFGTIDILINNAGNTPVASFLETTKEHWQQVLDDNFLSAVLCSQAAARIMLKRNGGKIINNSSFRGIEYAGIPLIIAYSCAKAALNAFTRTLAKELAPHINVNAVAPGFVYTQNYEKMSSNQKEQMQAAMLTRRFISMNEIAEAFLFLAQSDSITGEVLVVDGGLSLINDL
jgi:3-oxoacyl-[acyl-carrier protein] reductase